MTKAKLIETVARVADLPKKHAEIVVDTVFHNIVKTLHGALTILPLLSFLRAGCRRATTPALGAY